MRAESIPTGAAVASAESSCTIVSIATTRHTVEALRSIWNAQTITDIDSDLDYFLAVAENAEQVISPYVVRIRRGSGQDILIVARLEKLPVRLRLAYWKLGQVQLRAIVVTFGGVLGARSKADEMLAMQELRRLLDIGEADVILMRNVDPLASLNEVAATGISAIRLAHAQPVDKRWMAYIPGTLEMFLSARSAKSRSSYRREDRIMHAEFGDRMKLRRFTRLEELEVLCRDMESVSSRTYQRGLGAGFADTAMERALVSLGMRNGNYRCWMMYLDDRPISFWAGMAHGDTFYPTTPGFDPAYAEYSIGRHTMFRMIEDLCADPAISRIDFGRGDARYKEEYAVATSTATDVWQAGRRPWPILIIGALSLLALVNNHARRWVETHHWSERMKTLWRRRLVAKRPGPGQA